jgi:colanic acid biosynthesis glycosyl transferase WcaI
MARILLYTLVFSPDGVSTAILVSELMTELQALGYEVSVLTTVPHYNRDSVAEAKQPLHKKMFGLYYVSDYHGIKVIHVPMSRKEERVGGRFLDYMRFHFWSLLLGLFLIGRCDVVIAPSPPLTIGIVGWLLARLKGAKFVYDVQELYPALMLQVGMLTEDHWLYKVFLRLEKLVYTLSDHIAVITPYFKKAVVATGTPPNKVTVIPNFVVLDFEPNLSKSNPLAQELGLTDKYVVLYAGNIGMTHSFDTIIEVINRVRDVPDIHFLVVGDGVRRKYVEEQAAKHNLSNLTMLPWQPLEQMGNIYGTANLGLVPLMTGTAKTTIPSKIYTIMASGLPVLLSVDTDSDMVTLVQEANCGVSVPPDNAQAMEAALRKVYAQRDEFKQRGLNGRRFVEENYSRQAVGRQVAELIQRL